MQANLQADESQEVDINDAFEEILFCEEKFIEDGYKQGFAIGSVEDSIEGYHLGYHRGAEIGSELGYYKAFVEYHLNDVNKLKLPEKVVKNLEVLKQGIDDFPRTNTDKADLFELIEKNRTLYKLICTQLKIKFDFKKEGINF